MEATLTDQAPPAILAKLALEKNYRLRCEGQSDINEHLPVLRKLAESCGHITEFGTRMGNSTVAFLAAQPKRLICYDMVEQPVVNIFRQHAGQTQFTFHRENVLKADIEETDALFIDTWHVYEQLKAELKRHSPKVRRWIVMHDTSSYADKGETPGHLGLWPAIEEFLERGTFEVKYRLKNNNGLTVLKRIAPESAAREMPVDTSQVYLGIPYYQGIVGCVVDSHRNAMDDLGGSDDTCVTQWSGSAFHCGTFNDLIADCLNTRYLGWTHFAMVHSDVRPEGFWLSTMLREQRRCGADILSVVLPRKTPDDITSTALLERPAGKVRLLTMTEILSLPRTFGADEARSLYVGFDKPEIDLLVSDGLWICDLRKGLLENFTGFESRHRLVRHPATDELPEHWTTENVSEDWIFSAQMRKLGAKIMATRVVTAGHWGLAEYRNDRPNGTNQENTPEAYGDWFSW